MHAGVGLTVTLRLRVAAKEASRAGELVDGARVLALFGDVATELLIRLDGDEGEFRTYEGVEFLAPVRVGDYLEATGVVTKIGRTSRVIAFEARKVVSNARSPDLAPSAADALVEPLAVCRAIGTCVVPVELQRRPRLVLPSLSAPPPDHAQLPEPRPIITPPPRVILTPTNTEVVLTAVVSAAAIGARPGRAPASAQDLVDEAARCRDAGASVIHLHVPRGDAGARELCSAAAAAIRKKTDAVLEVSTEAAGSVDERTQHLACRPELATLACGSVNQGDGVLPSPRPIVRDLAARIRAAGSAPTLSCYDASHLDHALELLAAGVVASPLRLLFLVGAPGGLVAREATVRFLASQVPVGSTWALGAVGPGRKAMIELALSLGGNARIGEADGSAVTDPAGEVALAAEHARAIGRDVVDPDRARQLLSIES